MRNTRATSAKDAGDAGDAGDAAHRPDNTHMEPARAPVTSANLRQTRVPDDEDIHPDGSRAAFVLRDLAADQPKPVARIWTVPLDGGDPIALTAGPGNDTHPRWSPDGQQLAFLSTRDGEQDGGKAQLYLMPADRRSATTTLRAPQRRRVVRLVARWQPPGAADAGRQ